MPPETIKQIAILCHVEHLPAYDFFPQGEANPSWRTYSLNLSVALGAINNAEQDRIKKIERYLMPWLAENITTIRIFDGVSVKDASKTHLQRWQNKPINSSEFNPQYKALTDALKSDFDDTLKLPELFLWKGFESSEKLEVTRKFRSDAPAKPWDVMLGQTAQLPAPIPQLLNLSFIFSLNRDDGFDLSQIIYAAPVIKYSEIAGNPPGTPPTPAVILTPKSLVPATPSPLTDRPGAIKKWEYEVTPSIPDFSVFAYIKGCQPQRKRTGAFLDLGSLWVKTPPGTNTNYGEDWRAFLEDRLTNGFDLCQRIVERMNEIERGGNDKAKAQLTAAMPIYRQMFLAALRDLAGIGVTPSPGGDSLLEYALRKVNSEDYKDGLKQADRDKIIEAASNAFPDVRSWTTFIKSNLSSIDKLNIVAEPGEVDVSLDNSAAIAEFEQLYQAVLEPVKLAILVKAQWKKIIVDSNLVFVTPALKDDVTKTLSLNLTQIDMQRALALENVGRFWGDFIRSGLTGADGQPVVKNRFTCFLLAYYLLRFQRNCSDLKDGIIPGCSSQPAECDEFLNALKSSYEKFKVSPPFAISNDNKDLFTDLFNYLKSWGDKFAEKLLPGSIDDLKEENKPTETPHAITIMVDELSSDQARTNPDPAGADADYDPLESISGVGVLMREVTSGNRRKWRCLNLADVKVRVAANKYNKAFPPPLLVSYGLNYLNNLRQSFVSYNNHPLAAKSPIAHLSTDKNELKGNAANDQKRNDFLTFNDYHQDAKLTPLKFGSQYEILPFIIGNSGAIPKELARVDAINAPANTFAPCDIDLERFNKNFSGNLDLTSLKTSKRTFAYRRRVRIGQTRLFNATQQQLNNSNQNITVAGTCLNIPTIPENVFPRFRDVEQFIRTKSTESRAGKDEQPLILLTGEGVWKKPANNFSFLVRLPATDINTWDRWVASNKIYGENKDTGPSRETIKELRKKVWEKYHEFHNENQDSGSEAQCLPPKFDATLDDPALERKFHVELFRFDNGKFVAVQNGSKTIEVDNRNIVVTPATTPVEAYKLMQALPLKIDVAHNPNPPADPLPVTTDLNLKALTVNVRQGEIYKLKISCLLRQQDYPESKEATTLRRFAAIYEKQPEKESEANNDFYKVSSFEMFVEVARRDMDFKKEDALSALLMPDMINENGDVVAVDLNKTAPAASGFSSIYKIELLRQMWRWQGRDTKPHPESVEPQLKAQLDQQKNDWESVEYDSRDVNDYSVVDMSAEKTGAGTRKFIYKERLTGKNSDGKQVKEERRALHYRFRAKAHSRYAGLLPDDAAYLETSEWKSLYVPCRLNSLTVPKVRFIFPLTQNFGVADSKSMSAGLLVVLSEAWFEDAGIGEDLGVEVTTTQSPKLPQKSYFEMGPDPLNAIKPGSLFSTDEVKAKFGKIRGPVGHTFDMVGDFPLFTSTSFIIPAPYLEKNIGADVSQLPAWGMCEIRFRRVLRRKDKENLVSEFTDPYWVQFLPEFTKFSDNDLDASSHALRITEITDARSDLQIVQKGTQKPVELKATPSSTYTAYQLYIFLTSQVFDVMGFAGQEVFVGLSTPKGDGKTWSINERLRKNQVDRLRARIVEVQYRKDSNVTISNAAQLWDALFDKKTQDIKRARIVRVSEPFDI